MTEVSFRQALLEVVPRLQNPKIKKEVEQS